MADDIARAVGAGVEPIMIGGKECKVRPLTIKELAEVERACLKLYRASYLSTWAENLEVLPENVRKDIMEKKLEEAARWDVSDLPPKPGHDPDRIEMTTQLRDFMENELGLVDHKDDEMRAKRLTAIALDQKLLDARTYKKLSGKGPKVTPINYSQWWISSTFDGRIAMLTACMSPCGVTQDEIIEAFRSDNALAMRISSQIEELSSPSVGNG